MCILESLSNQALCFYVRACLKSSYNTYILSIFQKYIQPWPCSISYSKHASANIRHLLYGSMCPNMCHGYPFWGRALILPLFIQCGRRLIVVGYIAFHIKRDSCNEKHGGWSPLGWGPGCTNICTQAAKEERNAKRFALNLNLQEVIRKKIFLED